MNKGLIKALKNARQGQSFYTVTNNPEKGVPTPYKVRRYVVTNDKKPPMYCRVFVNGKVSRESMLAIARFMEFSPLTKRSITYIFRTKKQAERECKRKNALQRKWCSGI